MYESFRRRSCVSTRMDRKPLFVIVHTLLSMMICLCLACATRHEAGAPCPAIEMSAVADTPTDSSKTVTLNDTTTILISRTPLVATGDITGATASQADARSNEDTCRLRLLQPSRGRTSHQPLGIC